MLFGDLLGLLLQSFAVVYFFVVLFYFIAVFVNGFFQLKTLFLQLFVELDCRQVICVEFCQISENTLEGLALVVTLE